MVELLHISISWAMDIEIQVFDSGYLMVHSTILKWLDTAWSIVVRYLFLFDQGWAL